jgi:hypothetical protein
LIAYGDEVIDRNTAPQVSQMSSVGLIGPLQLGHTAMPPVVTGGRVIVVTETDAAMAGARTTPQVSQMSSAGEMG